VSLAGPFGWNGRILGGPRWLMGQELLQCPASIGFDHPSAGIGIEMMAGGVVYQRTPAQLAAPLDLDAVSCSIDFQGDSEESYYAWRRARSVAQAAPVAFWIAWPHEDVWAVRDASTTWTLSRSLAFDLVSPVTYAPRAFLRDLQGSTMTELTLITSGTPGAGEMKYDAAAASFTVETADLSASVGRVLVLRYHPLRLVRIEGLSEAMGEPNDLQYTVDLAEVVPFRTYG
jgi:hypothetical protein